MFHTIHLYVRYELECKDKCLVTIKPNNLPEEEVFQTEVNNDVKHKIEKMLKKYHVEKWNNFNKHDPNVLDGNSFSIDISMKNGETISASGYMKWPENYGKVSNELDEIFMQFYPNKDTLN